MNTVTLPWPYKGLSPNQNMHWRPKADATRRYRFAVAALALSARLPKGNLLSVWFYPPDKRPRDRDNMIAAFKAGQDGIADAMGIDDRNFVVSYGFGDPRKYGEVVVEVVTP